MPTPNVPLIDLLYQALNSENGVVVQTTDPEALRAKLYKLRREDDAFSCLSLSISRTNPESELYIVKS